MAQYKIIADNTTLGEIGATVTEEALQGINIEALIASGHIEALASKASKSEPKESE
jgi:hypothetical protein